MNWGWHCGQSRNINKKANQMCSDIEIDDDASKVGFNTIYPFATENISGYINEFNLKNHSLATVGSSCDQAINGIKMGSNNITIFDINPNIKFYYYLKLACLLELDYDEFFSFLCPTSYPAFYRVNPFLYDNTVFDKIKVTLKSLDRESFIFWENIFQNHTSKEISRLFSNDVYDLNTIKKCNPYLYTNIDYDDTKKRILYADIKFKITNIFNTVFNETFDNIWLSNIGQYLSFEDVKAIVEFMEKYLNIDGKMLICYFYREKIDSYSSSWNNITDINEALYKLIEKLNHSKLYKHSFEGIGYFMYKRDEKDAAIIYKK